MPYYVYILRCKDKTLYTGIATDPARRLEAHKAGKGARYTRAHEPERLVYTERCDTRGEALRKEAVLKKLSRTEKLALIATAK